MCSWTYISFHPSPGGHPRKRWLSGQVTGYRALSCQLPSGCAVPSAALTIHSALSMRRASQGFLASEPRRSVLRAVYTNAVSSHVTAQPPATMPAKNNTITKARSSGSVTTSLISHSNQKRTFQHRPECPPCNITSCEFSVSYSQRSTNTYDT